MRAQVGVLLLTAVAALPGALDAQRFVGLGGVLEQADLLYFSGRPREAWELLEGHVARDSTDHAALWRLTRSGLVLGIAEEGATGQNSWLDPAVRYGERAVGLEPDDLDARYWRAAAAGRRAMNAGPRQSVELAELVYDDAHKILAVDSLHGGAHNLLGKLNYEVMSLSWFERTLGRLLMGNEALNSTSWEGADLHLGAATHAWPQVVLFQFDLAMLHRKRGREQEALEVLRRVVALPAVHPVDASIQDEARRLLEDSGH